MKIALFISDKIGIKLYNFLRKNNKNVILIVSRNKNILNYFKNTKTNTVFYKKNKNDDIIVKELIDKNIDLSIVFKFCILPKKIWNLPKYKTINMHYSLLYSYSGPNPVEWQIHNKEKESGVSIVFISNKIDNGPIIVQEKINIVNKSITKVKNELDILGRKCILEAINLIEKYKKEVPIIKSIYIYSYYSYYNKSNINIIIFILLMIIFIFSYLFYKNI